MDDRYRTLRCGWCQVQLVVPPAAQSFRCAVCQYVTPVRGQDPVVAALSTVKHAAGVFKGLVSNISSGVNMLNATTGGGYAGQPVPCYGNCYPPSADDASAGGTAGSERYSVG
ncbi:hypothetical protein MLD38_023217 [Melastoma candidum]|uniref:Uncharacterized protein n=1 Tax=Melastoma candidum TaxID=119954 RepID=A0ACB9QLP5_9MYRT|nr:hypothetical protein MLD38_023217 [Melastoma candidum]